VPRRGAALEPVVCIHRVSSRQLRRTPMESVTRHDGRRKRRRRLRLGRPRRIRPRRQRESNPRPRRPRRTSWWLCCAAGPRRSAASPSTRRGRSWTTCARRQGAQHSRLPGVTRVVTWAVPAVISCCLRPYAVRGWSLPCVTRVVTWTVPAVINWMCFDCKYKRERKVVSNPTRRA
jgi:hypothetical protein